MSVTMKETTKNVSESIEDFTIDFYKSVASEIQGNFVCSALSAHVALSMTASGAGGSTAKEMRQCLHLPDDDNLTYQAFQDYIHSLNNIQKVILKLANKIYASKELKIKDKFKEIVSTNFHSECGTLDFSQKAEAVAEIDRWCREKTNDKIKGILKEDEVDKLTSMVLLNAVYFKGNWMKKFNTDATTLKPFHVNEKTTIDVPTMYLKEKCYYRELPELNAEVVALPYENEDLLMAIIIPRNIDGFKEIEQNLEKIKINYEEECKNYKTKICLSLPKFKVETTINLKEQFQQMGMLEMFSDVANFSGICDSPTKVDKVRQKAFIEVNEEGTEAAVVTAVTMRLRSLPLPPLEVNVDRPFLYKILYKNSTLFIGRIVNPLE